MRSKGFAIFLALSAIAAATAAEARPIRVLTIHGRSFIDSGKKAPVGSLQNYVTQSTTLNQPAYSTYLPDSFGSDVLPGRFGGIGR
jgi:hypothetical protein